MNDKYEAVIFDYGNVLSLDQPQGLLDVMAGHIGCTTQEFAQWYWQLRLPYDRGDFDGRIYWTEIARNCQSTISDSTIDELISVDNQSWSYPNESMLGWTRSLQSSGYKIAILSNMPVDFRRMLSINCSWLPEFDGRTYSCDLGVVKPQPQIYEHCLNQLKTTAERTLFIDDRDANLEGAQNLGMATLKFTTTDQVLARMEELFGLNLPNLVR